MKIKLTNGDVVDVEPTVASGILRKKLGSVYTDSAARADSNGNPMMQPALRDSPIVAPTGPNVLRRPAGSEPPQVTKTKARFTPVYDKVVESVFPRTIAALERGDGGKRPAYAFALDAASLPFRLIASPTAALGDDVSFLDALASTKAPKNTTGLEALAQEMVRDPLNAVFALRAPRVISKVGKYAPKLVRTATKAAVPFGLVKGAESYSDGAGAGEATVEGLKAAGLGAALGVGGEIILPKAGALTRSAGKGIADSKLGKHVVDYTAKASNWLMDRPNPLHLSAEAQLERGSKDLGARLLGPLRQAETFGNAISVARKKLAESQYEKAANERLVSLMKPAPAARDHLEVEGLRSALRNDPTMFDQITSIRDLLGTTSEMAKRTLDNREATLGPIWTKAAKDYEGTRALLDDLLSSESRHSDVAARWRKLQRANAPSNLLSPEHYGLSVRDVRDRAIQNAREAVNRGDWAGDADKLNVAIDDLVRRYARPDDLGSLVDASDFETMLNRTVPLGTGHKRKSNLFKYAYETGDPADELSNVKRFAADVLGKSHNEAHDALIRSLDREAPGFTEKLPILRLPEPPILPEDITSAIQSRELRASLARQFEGVEKANDWNDFMGGRGKKPEQRSDFLADAYGLQKDYLTGKRGDLTTDELLSTIAKDPSVDAFLNQRAQDVQGTYARLAGIARDQGLPQPKVVPVGREASRAGDDFAEMPNTLASLNNVISRLNAHELKRPNMTARQEASARKIREDLRHGRDAADENLKSLALEYAPRIKDFVTKLPKLKEARGGLLNSISGIRAADAASRPWYQINDALERAYYSRGNSRASEIKPSDLYGMPLASAALGAFGLPVLDLVTRDKSLEESLKEEDLPAGLLKDAALGATLGLGVGSRLKLGQLADKNPGAAKLLKYVHSKELWRNPKLAKDFAATTMKTGALRNASSAAQSSAQWLMDLLGPAYNDAPVDTTSTKLAEKRKKGK